MRQIISLMAIALIGLFTANTALGQGLSVNTTGSAADGSAMLDVSSSTQGVLVPRMDSAHVAAISSPATGLLVFQTNGVTPGFYYYTGSGWSRVGATPLPQYFGLVASSGPNGSISPAGTSIVSAGSTQVYSITPASGCSIGNVTVDGADVGAVGSYTFSSVTANHSINATFIPPTYSITATAGANGSISPVGTSTITAGSSQVYSITPSSGFVIYNVSVDGSSVGAVGTYTFSAVAASHTISVTFGVSVGQSYGGGIVGYILQSGDPGYSSSVQHGLIVATSDQATAVTFGCQGTNFPTTGYLIGTGAANTATILSTCTTTGIAAQMCSAYRGGGYSDWYMPSQLELYAIYPNRASVGGFSPTAYYFTSSTGGGTYFTIETFGGSFGSYSALNLSSFTAAVRAVRSF